MKGLDGVCLSEGHPDLLSLDSLTDEICVNPVDVSPSSTSLSLVVKRERGMRGETRLKNPRDGLQFISMTIAVAIDEI